MGICILVGSFAVSRFEVDCGKRKKEEKQKGCFGEEEEEEEER